MGKIKKKGRKTSPLNFVRGIYLKLTRPESYLVSLASSILRVLPRNSFPLRALSTS